MSFTFTESVNLVLPSLGDDFSSHTESAEGSALIVEIAAIHEGLTANYNNYSAEELAASIETWTDPYPRPVITNHDVSNEALGRIMQARMAKDNDLDTIMLQAAIRDSQAIQKFRDQRYLTGSVGGKAESAICSICGADWVKASSFELPCEHKRGSLYKGKLCYLDIKGINWKEYSMVNTPADSNSSVRSLSDAVAEGEDWVKAQIFAVDMAKESITGFGESGSYDVLAGKKRKDAVPMYHNIRGAFLSAFSVGEEDESDKEIDVTDPVENDDDILEISEGLSDALANDEPESNDEGAEDQSVEDADSNDDADNSTEDSEDESAEDSTDAPSEEDESDEGAGDEDESEDNTDESDETDPESVDQPEGEESDEGEGSSADEDDTEGADGNEGDESDNQDSQDDPDPEESDDTDTDLATAQERIGEQDAEIARLTEENTRLRAALKKGLAERVVDLKIDLGLAEADKRTAEIEEHVSRSASSLADSMVDLRKLASRNLVNDSEDLGKLFSKESGSTVVKNDKRVTMNPAEENDDDESESDPSAKLEQMAVEALMGRRNW